VIVLKRSCPAVSHCNNNKTMSVEQLHSSFIINMLVDKSGLLFVAMWISLWHSLNIDIAYSSVSFFHSNYNSRLHNFNKTNLWKMYCHYYIFNNKIWLIYRLKILLQINSMSACKTVTNVQHPQITRTNQEHPYSLQKLWSC
jgi:hypothetical protein